MNPQTAAPARGRLTAAGALVVMFVVAGAGATLDLLTGPGTLRRTFAVTLVVAAVVASTLVRRRSLWAVVAAPPLLYVVMSLLSTLAAPDGVFDSRGKLEGAFVGWLVYGFPEIATSTAAAALIAGVRLAARRTA